MIVKCLEIRDRATMFGVLAVDITNADNRQQANLLKHHGYGAGSGLILMTHLGGRRQANYDPYDWGDRTYAVAHDYIEKHFHELKDGDVVDVEYILGETPEPKRSEVN
jgi:hypothetical protein